MKVKKRRPESLKMVEKQMADFQESVRVKTDEVLRENAALRKQLEDKLEESKTTKTEKLRAENELLRKQLSGKQFEGVITAEAAVKVQ